MKRIIYLAAFLLMAGSAAGLSHARAAAAVHAVDTAAIARTPSLSAQGLVQEVGFRHHRWHRRHRHWR